jgi:hypothetical protein
MKVLIRAVVASLNSEDVKTVQDLLKSFVPDLSFSPEREVEELEACVEFRATGTVTKEQKEEMIAKIDDDWDMDEDETEYWAYGFNTKMITPLLYYIQLDFS